MNPQQKLPNKPVVITPTAKPPIIMIHGFRGSPIGLEDIASILRGAGYNVYTPAIPPFGGASAESYTPASYASYLCSYIEKHKINSPILIGHSMGSIIAAATAYTSPEILHKKLILLSPISTKTNRLITPLVPLSAIAPSRTVDYVSTRFLFVPHNNELFRETLEVTHQSSNDHPPARREVLAAAKFSSSYSVSDFPFNRQTLIIAAENDRLVNKNHTIRLATKLQAQLKFLPDSGHLHNYEKPQETAEEIINFIENF